MDRQERIERASSLDQTQNGTAAPAVEEEKGCSAVLHLVVAARGAMNSLMAEIIEDHIRAHVVDPHHERGSRAKGAEELIEIVQSYLR